MMLFPLQVSCSRSPLHLIWFTRFAHFHKTRHDTISTAIAICLHANAFHLSFGTTWATDRWWYKHRLERFIMQYEVNNWVVSRFHTFGHLIAYTTHTTSSVISLTLSSFSLSMSEQVFLRFVFCLLRLYRLALSEPGTITPCCDSRPDPPTTQLTVDRVYWLTEIALLLSIPRLSRMNKYSNASKFT